MSGQSGANVGASDDLPPGAGWDLRDQIAALPWRMGEGIEILLVSSRETRRWIIPKGWPVKGKKPHRAAELEAYEEAGLEGKIEKIPFGVYHYSKRLGSGAEQPCRVDVYPLKVVKQYKKWPEKGQRELRWLPAAEAAASVNEAELATLIRAFAATFAPR